ncbi:MAG: SGNH/GDSL hydrolase family protein, partial [Ignavibacteria bacterium]|nr:SGNH/GDSL hydrolase family protein [Ignavibacteria bacterium]
FIIGLFYFLNKKNMNSQEKISAVNYVALGDSYTIGEGAWENESWPSVLTSHLWENGVSVKLVANTSVTGFTTQNLIDNELSVYDSSDPEFTTLLIGINDWVQGVDKDTFHKNLITILDHMQTKLPQKNNLILVTIPDFSATPTGRNHSNGRDISQGISEFNEIIKDEAKLRNLPVVDIYPVSQKMKDDSSLIAQDGLHPSAPEYAIWEKLIYPEAYKMLKK